MINLLMDSHINNSFFQLRDKELLSRIPLNAKVILEVGCGQGSLGYEYKKKNPAVKYIGIESSTKDAEVAIDKLDTVIIGDVEDFSIWIDRLPKIDCLIFNNVLQYLKNPFQLLIKQSEFLINEAIVITLFSNPNHWSFLEKILKGSFFLDDQLYNHNFFHRLTPENLTSIFNENSFQLFDTTAIRAISDSKKCNAFLDKLSSSLSNFILTREELFSRISPSYYISRAGYINNNKQQKIDILLGDIDIKGVFDSRILIPYKLMSTQPRLDINISNSIAINNNIFDYPKVFIISRPIHLRNKKDINKIKNLIDKNYLIIIDYDDDPNIIPKKYIGWNFTFTSAHAIQTSNNYLANYLSSFNPEVKVFRNSVPQIGDVKEPLKTPYLRIFFGALNRKKDWFPWIKTFNNISNQYPNKLFFDVVHDFEFYNSIDSPQTQKRFTPTCDYPTYLEIMKGCDICFLPLNNNQFNNCKSDLKAVEAGSFGLALLASSVVYSENFTDGINASFFNDSKSLSNILSEWILDPSKVRSIGRRAQKYVLNNRLFCYQIDERREWYDELWSRKDDLTKSIYNREPNIF